MGNENSKSILFYSNIMHEIALYVIFWPLFEFLSYHKPFKSYLIFCPMTYHRRGASGDPTGTVKAVGGP